MKLHNHQNATKFLIVNDRQMLVEQLWIFAERRVFCAYVIAQVHPWQRNSED